MKGVIMKHLSSCSSSIVRYQCLSIKSSRICWTNFAPKFSYLRHNLITPSELRIVKSLRSNGCLPLINTSCFRNYSTDGGKSPADAANIATASSNEEETKSKTKQSKFKRYAIYTLCIAYGTMFGSILYNLGLPDVDEEGRELRDEFSDLPPIEQFFKRMFDRLYIFKEFLRRPSREKLLPDPPPAGSLGAPKYTLVLELTHVLLHPDWTYQTGWRFKKRPNLDYFLEQLASPMYEIVVFTTQVGMNMSPIVDVLNKNNAINYTLYRDATEFINGEHVKNLNCLNRDLSKVIVIDWNPNSLHLNSENALILPKWTGNDDDNTLVELVAFLKNVAEKQPEDLRDILSYYKQFADPMENFRESKRKLPDPVEVASA